MASEHGGGVEAEEAESAENTVEMPHERGFRTVIAILHGFQFLTGNAGFSRPKIDQKEIFVVKIIIDI